MHERYRRQTDRRQTDGFATTYSERELDVADLCAYQPSSLLKVCSLLAFQLFARFVHLFVRILLVFNFVQRFGYTRLNSSTEGSIEVYNTF